jgi:outer membrane receptor protein involved in Fe transport
MNTNWRSTVNSWKTEIGLKDSALNFLWNQDADRFATTIGYDLNLDYRRKFDKKDREFGWSAQVSKNTDNSDYTSKRLTLQEIVYRNEKSVNIGENLEISTQMDFTEPINKKLSLETGIKGILRFVNSDYHFDTLKFATGEYTSMDSRNNAFHYYQNVGAAYLQFNYILNENYSVKLGGRYEFTSFGGGMDKPLDSSFTGKPYSNFIPFVNISRKLGKSGFIKFNYTQRIQRPSLFYLNPYTNYSDPLNLTTGNPYLAPEISSNYEISVGNYTQFGGFGLNVYHKRLNNAIETYRMVDANKVYQTTYGNIGRNITTGFDLNVNLKGKNWMISGNGGLGWVDISSIVDTGLIAGLKTSGLMYSAGIRGSYSFGKSWMIELFSRFNAPSYSLQGYTANWFFHMIGIKKRFNKDKGGIGLGVDNPFAWQVDYKTENSGKDFNFYELRRTNMWGFRINFDYSFGSIESEKIKPVERKLKNDDLKDGENQGGQQ